LEKEKVDLEINLRNSEDEVIFFFF